MTASLSDLGSRILKVLEQSTRMTGSDLATLLGEDRKTVAALLHGELKDRCVQDSRYRWSLAPAQPAPLPPVAPSAPVPVRPAPALAASPSAASLPVLEATSTIGRLCAYYLSCLARDDSSGITVPVDAPDRQPSHHVLPSLPEDRASHVLVHPDAMQVLGRLDLERGLTAYLGYPCLVRSGRGPGASKTLEPLLLLPIDPHGGANGGPCLDSGFPIINQAALKALTKADPDLVLAELLQIETELGLSAAETPPTIDDLARRLQATRPAWPWREDVTPEALNAAPVGAAEPAGIFNRAVVLVTGRSSFTQGLEAELAQLGEFSAEHLASTALGQFLHPKAPDAVEYAQPAIEVLPMNSEQRTAVSSALSAPLTIITGPPGTGKSQVVANLLVTAAWQGKKVLFASKNNKAVDVVESRVNALSPRPILIRLGGHRMYQHKLAEYLISLLSASATPDDMRIFDECRERDTKLRAELAALGKEEEALIGTRNAVDRLEQSVEHLRPEVAALAALPHAGAALTEVEQALAAAREAHAAASAPAEDGLIASLKFKLGTKALLAALDQTTPRLLRAARTIGLEVTLQASAAGHLHRWPAALAAVHQKAAKLRQFLEYRRLLVRLQGMRSLEDIAAERRKVTARLGATAGKLWKAWIRVQPLSLHPSDRQMLQKYRAVLKMVLDAGTTGEVNSSVQRQYKGLFQEVAHLLPCWAVSALSAKGRIPFQAGYFDLVVFDEASQCDIASALPLLYRAKRAVVIGDPKQLAHIAGLPPKQDQQLLELHGLVESHPHWAFSYNSLFDLAAGCTEGRGIVALRDHHRCHSDIIEFSNRHFYEGRLRPATRHSNLHLVPGQAAGIDWVDVNGRARRDSGSGVVNEVEAKAVVAELRRLLVDEGYTGSIGVVSPFRAQVNCIRDLVNADAQLVELLAKADFLVDTVHKFQGDERDVIVFSPVLAPGMTRGAETFLARNGNLFNVAITRARAHLLVVGSKNSALDSSVEYLKAFAKYSWSLTAPAAAGSDGLTLDAAGPEYPAVVDSDEVSDGERLLYSALYRAGVRPVPQYSVESYRLDFAVFSGDRKLAIEVDGERYHSAWTGELCYRDQLRNIRLLELGWEVQRFWVYELRDDLEGCVRRVHERCRQPVPD